MNIRNVLENSSKIEKIAHIIKVNCKKFLQETNGLKVYRGVTIKNDVMFGYKKIRTDRRTLVTGISKDFFNGFDDGMKLSNFKATRSNSILCTGSIKTSAIYGLECEIFISGDFNYSWSDKISDYSAFYKREIDKNVRYDKESVQYEKGIQYWNKFKDTYYNSKNLIDAIESTNEIMFSGKGYYYLPIYHKLYHEIRDLI